MARPPGAPGSPGEEDTTKAGTEVKGTDGKMYTLQKDHGYVFEVFPDVVAKQIPEPIKCRGRAVWEGAAIDPSRKFAYITEDTGAGLFYRWTAPAGKKISKGIARQFGENDGVLQAAQLVKNGKALVHYGELTIDDLGKAYPVKWVDGGEDRQAQKSDLRKQFPGATVHPKIEGCWPDETGLWFTLSYVNAKEAAKYGIDEDWGMVVHYDFAKQTMTVKEFYEAGNAKGAVVPGDATEQIKQFHGPDNITVTPWGGVVITEDGDNPCSLISIGKNGGSREFARDIADRGEWAGPCFNKSGNVLFASIQGDCTYAITGPLRPFMVK
ncbi:alkaline phosphatase PhoX [Luteococcus sp. Sow4_B9]|uniref:alkaline phosphatase PhoX n=1 Tax=Luteococcus sp. Sow4_B9 TaxID=3438792 RepID=UPI003F9CDA4F